MRCAISIVAAVFAAAPAGSPRSESGETFRHGKVSLYYEPLGKSEGVPLVVVHGGPASDHMYLHVSDAWEALAKRRPVVFYDQRGNGRSGPLGELTCTLDDAVSDLEALRVHLNVARMDILGNSWGGFVAMAYATKHHDRVAHLVLVDSAPPKITETVDLFDQLFPDVMAERDALNAVAKSGDEASYEKSRRLYLSMVFYSPAKRDELLRQAHTFDHSKEVKQRCYRDAYRDVDLTASVGKLAVPTLVMNGRFDANVAPVTAHRIHKAIPGSKLVFFEKSGHMPWFEESDAFVKTLERFLE